MKRLSKRTTNPIMGFLSCDSSVFLSRDLQSALPLCFRWFRRRLFYNKTHSPTTEPGCQHCPKARAILGNGHVTSRPSRSCRYETLLVSAGLLSPCGFPAGLSDQSRDWVGLARPQGQHGPGAQLTSCPQKGREGNESHWRQPAGFHCLTG